MIGDLGLSIVRSQLQVSRRINIVYIKPVWLFVARSFTTKVATLPGQTEHITKTTKQLTEAIDAKLEILKIRREQPVTRLRRRTSRPQTDCVTHWKKKVDEAHSLKITVQEKRFEPKEDKQGILERRVQTEEREGEFEKAKLAIKEFRGAEMVEMETAAKEEEERAEKQRTKNFDDEMKLEKAKLKQKLKYE